MQMEKTNEEDKVAMKDRTSSSELTGELSRLSTFFENQLTDFYESKPSDIPGRLWESMTYSLKAGGKRIRPILCMKACEFFDLTLEDCFPLALGIEIIHTASLIHDDLPCMDNDSLRRGVPTNHTVFGETLALLAGTSLFIYGLQIPLQQLPLRGFRPERVNSAVAVLAKAAGPEGIHGGQILDTDILSQLDSDDFVWEIARFKTACLIRSALESGALLSGASEEYLKIISSFGTHLGLAFQIVDDILDVKSEASTLGKTPGKDIIQKKRTFVSSFGLKTASELAAMESEKALVIARELGPEGLFFQQMALFLLERSH